MRKFNRYQNVKTSHWIKYEEAQRLGIKVKGFSPDYKKSKIFVPPPTSHLNFRLKKTGKFINKYKAVKKIITPELYIEGKRQQPGKILPKKYSETDLRLIIGKFKNIAKKKKPDLKDKIYGGKDIDDKIYGGKDRDDEIEYPLDETQKFLDNLIDTNEKRTYPKLREQVVSSFIDYGIENKNKKNWSSMKKEAIKLWMVNFINDLEKSEQEELTREQLLDIYNEAKEEVERIDFQSDIPF